MANAKKDENGVSTILGALESDGTTIVPIVVNPTNHGLGVDDNTTGSDHGPEDAPRDENSVPVMMAVSSVDGVTPVIIYAQADGKLLIDSN